MIETACRGRLRRDHASSTTVRASPPHDLPKVFDPFFTKRAEGTGLGLTIVHRIIDEHEGHIEVESSAAGTSFKVTLPAVLDE